VRKAKLDGRLPVDVTAEEAERHYAAMGGPRRPDPPTRELAAIRLEREQIKCRLAELRLARAMGTVVDLSAAQELGGDLAETMRQGLDQLVPTFIQATGAAKNRAAAERAVGAILARFHADFVAQMERRLDKLAGGS
jgi:hypothetical protein